MSRSVFGRKSGLCGCEDFFNTRKVRFDRVLSKIRRLVNLLHRAISDNVDPRYPPSTAKPLFDNLTPRLPPSLLPPDCGTYPAKPTTKVTESPIAEGGRGAGSLTLKQT